VPPAAVEPDPSATSGEEGVPLEDLAYQIRTGIKDLKGALGNALRIALDVGDALAAARKRVPSRKWQSWLRENCLLSVRTANLYVELAGHRDEIEAEIDRAGEMSLRAAKRLISKRPEDAPDKDAPPAGGREPPPSKPGRPTTRPQGKDDAAHDIGADSCREAERLRVRVEELQAQVRQRDIKITGLESEIEQLRGKLATGTGGDMSISEFQTAHKQWEETFEALRGIIAKLEDDNAKLRAGVAELDDANDKLANAKAEPAAQAEDAAPPPAAADTPDDLPLPPFPWRVAS